MMLRLINTYILIVCLSKLSRPFQNRVIFKSMAYKDIYKLQLYMYNSTFLKFPGDENNLLHLGQTI
jgi:hypothetical protein